MNRHMTAFTSLHEVKYVAGHSFCKTFPFLMSWAFVPDPAPSGVFHIFLLSIVRDYNLPIPMDIERYTFSLRLLNPTAGNSSD